MEFFKLLAVNRGTTFCRASAKRPELPSPDKINCPEPLKAILLTGDRVDVAMKDKCSNILNSEQINENLAMLLKEILSIGFDHIFTTNYTYELEQAAIYPRKLTEYKMKKMAASTTGIIDKKYLLHTYNKLLCNGVENKIWHIHGESRKADSTILGHYYYGNSLFKIKESVDKIRAIDSEDDDAKTWAEAFIFSDIYCLGFGTDFANLIYGGYLTEKLERTLIPESSTFTSLPMKINGRKSIFSSL